MATHRPHRRSLFPASPYIEALAQSIERAYAQAGQPPDILVCSYHGVPKRYLMEGDPYHCQCQKTTRLLKERLGWDDTRSPPRSSPVRSGRVAATLHGEEVARLAEEDGKKNIAVCAPAFSADCIETLEEINEEIKESFEEAGGEHFTYIPCLNDDDAHIKALARWREPDRLAGMRDVNDRIPRARTEKGGVCKTAFFILSSDYGSVRKQLQPAGRSDQRDDDCSGRGACLCFFNHNNRLHHDVVHLAYQNRQKLLLQRQRNAAARTSFFILTSRYSQVGAHRSDTTSTQDLPRKTV